MPSSNLITDTSEIKNDVNGFDLVECYKQGKSKIYISFPNFGTGLLAQTAVSANPEFERMTNDSDYVFKPELPSGSEEENIFSSNKETKFKPYSGLTREMFVTSVDMVTGCSNGVTLGNSIHVCIPWKIFSTNDVSSYIKAKENDIIESSFLIADPDTVTFDYYLNTFKMAMDALTGSSGKVDEILDGITASIMRYATAGIDFLNNISSSGDTYTESPTETRWARPYFTAVKNYNPMTDRAEYTDLFTETRDRDIYFKKIAEGRSAVTVNDIFVKPCVLFGIEDGINNRLFYSKELSDMVMNNISIEGAKIAPVIEYTRTINIYGYEGTDSPQYLNKIDISNLSGDLGITIEELDALTGSGYFIKEHMISMCSDTPSIKALDWSDENAFTGTLKDSENILTTPRPPVFSMGEAYIDENDLSGGTLHGRLPFYYSYIVPSISDGYLAPEYFDEMDFMGFGYYHAEGYDKIIKATQDYLNILKDKEQVLLQQAPAIYPQSKVVRDLEAKLGTWRIYSANMTTVNDGIVSGRPCGPNFTAPFISNINQGEYPRINRFTIDDMVPYPDPKDVGEEWYNDELMKYAQAMNQLIEKVDAMKKYRDMLYQYLGPSSNVVYDYTMYPINITDNATYIKAQPDTAGDLVVTAKPDKGVSIYKGKTDTFHSMSADPTFMDVGDDGIISLARMLKKSSTKQKYSQYVNRISGLVSASRKTVTDIKNFADNHLLVLDYGISLPNGKAFPVFVNNECSVKDALVKPYIGESQMNDLMYINEASDELFPNIDEMIESLISIWDSSSGSLLDRLVKDSDNNKGDNIKLYADVIRHSIIEPTRLLCLTISTTILRKDTNDFMFYYTRADRESRGYVSVTPFMQSLGTWFYNERKVYLLLMSICSLLQSLVDGIDNYMIAIMKDYIPNIITMEPEEGEEQITSPFDSFAFMNGNSPLYPILLADINISEIPTMYLNQITRISPLPETMIYRMKINLKELAEVKDTAAVVMPGFGIYDQPAIDGGLNPYFWNNNTLFHMASQPDTVNLKFTNLQQGISQDDFVQISDGQLKAIDKSSNTPTAVKLARSDMEQVIRNTSEELPEIPAMTVTGVIDAGYILPFYDKAQSLKSNVENVDILYNGMNPINVSTSIDFTKYSGTREEAYKIIDSDIKSMINAYQLDPRTNTQRQVFKNPATIEKQIKNIVSKTVDKILSDPVLKVFLSPGSIDRDINITTISHSFARSGATERHTNNILQGYLFPEASVSSIMTEANIVTELKGSDMWFNYNASTGMQHRRNFNVYLSKRRSHYSAHLLLLSIMRQKLLAPDTRSVSITDANTMIITTDGFNITFKISDTKPSGNSYKLFNSYGFGGLFFNINTKDHMSISKDIEQTIRSQMKLSDEEAKTSSLSFSGDKYNPNDRIRYSIDITAGGDICTAPLPPACLLFPDENPEVITSKSKDLKAIYTDNAVELPLNFGTSATSVDVLYEKANVARAKEKAQLFLNNHLSCFRVDSFIDKVWVIIEER